ncbi:MAG: alpha-1,2-fucosyltransferase [Paludibacter sp.]
MIIISLFGGLGNQMFQYACGKTVATRLGVELKLDISHLVDRSPRKNFTYRDYELSIFDIKDEIASLEEVRRFIPNLWNSNKFTQQFYRMKRLCLGNSFFKEKTKFVYNKEIDSVSDNTYLYGYFQTEKYFNNLRNDLLKYFNLVNIMDEPNSSLIAQMKNQNSVSIHVRRGDYTNSPFNLLSLQNYYLKAIKLIQEKIDSPFFYIFTNDYKWVEENFTSLNINKSIVDINTDNQSFLDMILMSNCKHNICANSSFSWWGAWLNTNPVKVVITPEKWFKNTEYIESTYDLIPSNWVQI